MAFEKRMNQYEIKNQENNVNYVMHYVYRVSVSSQNISLIPIQIIQLKNEIRKNLRFRRE